MTTGTGIILLHKEKFDFYSAQFGKIVEFKFIPEIVRDFDVANTELLENLIKLFVESNKIPKTELIIVVSDNASFTKDIVPPVDPVKQQSFNLQEETNHFIDSVPFDEVASMSLPMTQGNKVWATNKGLCDVLTEAFDKNGFKVTAILPGILFGPAVGTKPLLDAIAANIVFQKADIIKADHNLLTQHASVPEVKKEEAHEQDDAAPTNIDVVEEAPKKQDKKRLFLLVGVFVVLIIVLVVVYMNSM